MHIPRDIQLHVTDWPNYGKTADMALDERLFADDESFLAWCRQRFGPGSLHRLDDERYSYERKGFAPRAVRRLLGLLLNKSYK